MVNRKTCLIKLIICVNKIETVLKDTELEVPDLAYILYRWKNWSSVDKPKRYVQKLIKSDIGLVKFIKGFMWQSSSQTLDDRVSVTKWNVNTESVKPFIDDLDYLRARVEKIPKSFIKKLDRRGKLAIELFLESFVKSEDLEND